MKKLFHFAIVCIVLLSVLSVGNATIGQLAFTVTVPIPTSSTTVIVPGFTTQTFFANSTTLIVLNDLPPSATATSTSTQLTTTTQNVTASTTISKTTFLGSTTSISTSTSTTTMLLSTTLTGGGTATGFGLTFSPTYWQCNQQILVTLTGPFSVYVNAGDQIEFSYYQYSTGNTQQLMFKDTQTWLSGNTIQYYIQPSEWNYISFSYLPYIYVIVNDITVPSNAKPIQLYSAAQSGANPSNCGGTAPPQVQVTYTTYTQLYSTTVNQYVTVGGTVTVVPATTLASRTVTPIISVTRYITNATENRTLTNMAATTTTNSTVVETSTSWSTYYAPVGNVTMETFGYYAAIFAGLVGIGFLFKYKDIIARKRGKKTNPPPTESDAEVELKTRKRRAGKHAVALEPIPPKDQQTLIDITKLDEMNAGSPG